ncbi:MAG: co-chaperone DjlA [Woeseiaceae bacterium]|nr:co-chaperone DjlA [Woeseiaceae bacterium]
MYWGKIIGTLAGLATMKPLLGLLGLVIGHQFDRGFSERSRQFKDQDNAAAVLGDAYVRALFQAIGYLAKVDGRVTENEIRAARSIMHRLGLGPARVREAIAWFNEGKESGFALNQRLREMRRADARRHDARTLFVRLLLEVSLSKTKLPQAERAAIWSICQELDIGRVELAQLEAMIRAQKGFRRSPAGDADTARVKAAYQSLGVSQTATNDEIKMAYRRLMNKNHPDKIAASSPEVAELAEAERRTREVRTAYELLKTRRAIR